MFCYNFGIEVLGLVLSLFQSSNNLFESSEVKVLHPMKPLFSFFSPPSKLGQEQTHDLNTSCAELAFSRGSNRLNQFAHCFRLLTGALLSGCPGRCLAASPGAAGIPLPAATSSGAAVCGQQPLASDSPTDEAVQKTQAKVGGLSGVSGYGVKESFMACGRG